MTYKDFFSQIAAYYGSYTKVVFVNVASYVKGRFKEDQLAGVYKRILEYHSIKWKSVPDVAIIAEATIDMPKIMCQECLTLDKYHYFGCSKITTPQLMKGDNKKIEDVS